MGIWESILLAVSLCADCFACTLCSGVTLSSSGRVRMWRLLGIALACAVLQAGLLLCGWAFGNLFVGLVQRISHWIGFLLLLYVGGAMFLEGVRGKSEHLNLDGFKGILLGGVATSIDAAVVGLSMAMDTAPWASIAPISVSIFVFTALSVVAGMCSGSFVGRKLGYSARIIGGLVLIGLGINILL